MTRAFIRALTTEDQSLVAQFVYQHWGATYLVVHETRYEARELPGFVAIEEGEWVGLLLYHLHEQSCEIVTLDSLQPGSGCGTALLEALKSFARQHHCTRIWLITTNDNLEALRFYQHRHFVLSALYPSAVMRAREQKPEIPLFGNHGIPIRDEIELELSLSGKTL